MAHPFRLMVRGPNASDSEQALRLLLKATAQQLGDKFYETIKNFAVSLEQFYNDDAVFMPFDSVSETGENDGGDEGDDNYGNEGEDNYGDDDEYDYLDEGEDYFDDEGEDNYGNEGENSYGDKAETYCDDKWEDNHSDKKGIMSVHVSDW